MPHVAWDGEMEADFWPDIYEASDQKQYIPALFCKGIGNRVQVDGILCLEIGP